MKFNNVDFDTYFKNYPDTNGYFGKYGGSYIPPELQVAMNEISEAYQTICKSRKFIDELRRIRKEFQGRPTPISHLARLSDKIGTGVQLYVKREDLNHTGAHKLNHCMGEVLLAKYMGKKKPTPWRDTHMRIVGAAVSERWGRTCHSCRRFARGRADTSADSGLYAGESGVSGGASTDDRLLFGGGAAGAVFHPADSVVARALGCGRRAVCTGAGGRGDLPFERAVFGIFFPQSG